VGCVHAVVSSSASGGKRCGACTNTTLYPAWVRRWMNVLVRFEKTSTFCAHPLQHHNHTQAMSRIRIGHVFFGRRYRCRCRGSGALSRSSRTRLCGTCSSSCCYCSRASGLWSKHQTTRRRRRRRRSTRIVHYLFFVVLELPN